MPHLRSSGDVVTVRCLAYGGDPETWLEGRIVDTLTRSRNHSHALHVVRALRFKWEHDDPWGPYTGVPKMLARETSGVEELEWLDTWPRRHGR